ncbi:MAG: hypothetical protein WHV44_10035 [Anaerolineales bacterium]
MDERTFPCPACGGPVAPNPGEKRTICSYCGVSATVPKNFIPRPRQQAAEAPAAAPPRPTPPPSRKTDPEQVADVLRKAQPIAVGALSTYAWWTTVKRFIPGCLIALIVLCVLSCLAGVALLAALTGNFNF